MAERLYFGIICRASIVAAGCYKVRRVLGFLMWNCGGDWSWLYRRLEVYVK